MRFSRSTASWRTLLVLVILGLLLTGCQKGLPPGAQQHSGQGSSELSLSWDGPAIIHIQARQGSEPFRVSAGSGLETVLLVSSEGPVDEYRGHTFSPSVPTTLSIQGNRAWEITLLPPSPENFPVMRVPGTYQARGSAVLMVEGEYGIATFDIDRARRIEAWACGPDGMVEKLYINPDGDYKGKSVLPQGMGWLVVSADGPWSVKILEPCCQPH